MDNKELKDAERFLRVMESLNKHRWLIPLAVAAALMGIGLLVTRGNNRETEGGAEPARNEVVMETTMGTIVLRLLDETPQHRDNFIALVEDHAYDSLLFHRVIENFMIQAGDPDSKNAEPGALLGEGDRPYTVPAEFRLEEGIYHKRGVLAAARENDDVNPLQASSAMQFYITWGRVFDEEGIAAVQAKLDARTGGKVKLTDEMIQTYMTTGGVPHLDGQYTVFGEVLEGLEVVDAIQKVETDGNDRPLEDVRIIKCYLRNANCRP